MRQQQRFRTGTRSRKRSLATSVAATDYDHIKTVGKNHLFEGMAMFHVKHGLERECVFYRAKFWRTRWERRMLWIFIPGDGVDQTVAEAVEP